MMTPEFKSETGLSLDTMGAAYVKEIAKWSRFLAIVGFVMMGIMILGGLFLMVSAGTLESSMDSPMPFSLATMGILYLIMAAIFFYPNLKLYNFATKAKAAIASGNSALLNQSLGSLKSTFKFFGVLTAIFMGLYALIFLMAIVAGSTGGLMNR